MLEESFEAAERLPQNQTPIRKFALEQARALLAAAGVLDVIGLTPDDSNNKDHDLSVERFGSIIRKQRETSGYSLRDLSSISHTSPNQISRIERELGSPTEETMVKLAQATNMRLIVIETSI